MNLRSLLPRSILAATLCILIFALPARVRAQQDAPQFLPGQLDHILDYIAHSWGALTRSMTDCATLADPKTKGPSTLYLPRSFAMPEALKQLHSACAVR